MKLLVVEDEGRLAALLRKGLAAAGHPCDLAATVGEALDFLAASEYDGMVLDRLLPDGDGLDLCRQLRRQGRALPVLVLTARDSVDDRIAGLEAGADDYLVKPFAFGELIARLAALSRRPPVYRGEDEIRAGDLVLNLTRRTAVRGGRVLALTPKEFAVLELLASRPGQVFSRDRILDRVWGADREPSANVVEAVIARLRHKLDAGASPLIRTVRGFGYKIDP
ncbi:Response regulator MprA [Candidatus Hydrogenisulfobacillus filiaventi]|uniref:Stage 0 sporulation protein A homolog n=1 Tax=Candidatus Hydrogenisulfobacillus filiaventi TaxID=2707344 RepID=A0A6F8ZJS1_9FIRM|nr:response regulator transcription factor [Bacillota bacterium]CAB1129703.1 Response regulator MprA [Candidatus Hydrogenisulfobacillus filiaventi]